MKPIFAAIAALSVGQLSGQELMTAEQLLNNARNSDMATAVLLYVAGWRDGTSAQLLYTAASLREAGGDIGQHADYEEALGRCLGGLQATDLIRQLQSLASTGGISPQQSFARTALLDAAVELCRLAIPAALTEN
ncbi:MAG: hypothetical protein OEM78_15015 [Gammaproteobacteria bacterium]|nr:hypothetical protein [Gammaproteobacteria bacterium]